MGLAPGTKLGPYEVVSLLGAGGMGEVYRASDTKLGRDVALKILPAEMAGDSERLARFQREARALAQLDHANIVTIYSVEESEGTHFLTMQLVEGLPLDRLISGGGLPVEQIVEIAQALADALAAAHEKGIVHRDLKPANVMVTKEGRVKVLDFGLAKDVRASNLGDATLTSAGQTAVGVVMGTPAYMSPEQTAGRPLDHRTDIFSLGVLLYEMSTGRRPFEGSSSAELISAILRDTPQPVTDTRPDLPSDLARIIRRCLEKDPQHRVQTARDVSNEFRDLARNAVQPASLSSSTRTAPAPDSGATRADEGFWVAVLPFKYTGANQDLKGLAEGLSEEVITGLSRFSYLRVIARGSTAKYSSESGDVRAIGKELDARYVMEGSLRQAGSKLRLAVQLVDTVSGSHLWAETYERNFTPESIFELQDDLVPRIVSTVADQHGVLPRSMSEVLRKKNEDSLTPHEASLRAFSYFTRLTSEEHAATRRILESAVRKAPDHADCWAMLSLIYIVEYSDGYNALPDPLGRALAAADRAIDLAPTHSLGHYASAFVYFFRKEKAPFLAAVDRAVSLNPMDGTLLGLLGMLLHHSGDEERGLRMAESGMQLNPNYPGMLRFTAFSHAYLHGKYEQALEAAVRINMPGFFYAHACRAAALGQLGQREAAQKAVRDLLALRSDFASTAAHEFGKWWNPEQVEHLVDGLRKAGLEIPDGRSAIAAKPAAETTGISAATAPSIAVLPFANMSKDKEQDYFSDGLAEEIINLLAQIPGLKVIARTSAFAFRGKEQDIRGIAETLGVSNILEGSVRLFGSRIRVTAQLINAADGSHLWSERYDREISDIFAVQDEISAAIANTLRVKLSRDGAPQRYTPKLPAYEAYLKAKYHEAKVTPESMELARRFFEQACELDPAYAMPHVGLGVYWYNLAHFGRHFAQDCVPPARAEAQRALQIDPTLAEAHALLGYISALYDADWAAVDKYFASPMAKEVALCLCRPAYSWVQFWRGNVDQAIELAERAIGEDPLEVWAHMNLHAYLQAAGRDDEALEQLKRVVELDPNQVVALASMAMIYADKGDLAEALKIARRAYAIGPWSPDPIGILAGLSKRNGDQIESSLTNSLGTGDAPGDARAHALFHLLCGEIEEGADWTERAIEQRDSSMMLYLRFVVCRALRASPRWPKIAKMINLPA